MPHLTVEYTANIEPHVDLSAMLRDLARRCGDSDGLLPVAGVRVRAIRLTDYVIADDRPEYAFVNITVKLAQGRINPQTRAFFAGLFDAIKAWLADASAACPLALSMYLEEIDERGAFRQNGVRTALGLPQK